MPAVTVVIPAFNSEQYIGEALLSIRDQSLREFEVIVVDDGSTDGTLDVADNFKATLDIKLLKQGNAGPAAARNAGIRRASGRYCAFLDADDVMLPERLAAQLDLFEKDNALGLVHTDLMTFDDRGMIHKTKHAFSKPCGGMVLDRLLLDNFITTSTVMAPKKRLLEAGLFDESRHISEDFELWLRMSEKWKVGFIDIPLVRYRRRPGSLSNDKLVTARMALDVVETFWNERSDYSHRHPQLKRKSLAYHHAAAGSAALIRGKPKCALSHLLVSLKYDFRQFNTWKWLAKVFIKHPDDLFVKGAGGCGGKV